jgi:hypothetical protein
MESMDLDVDHYTIEELSALLNIVIVTDESVRISVKQQLERHAKSDELVTFFTQIQKKILDYLQEEEVKKSIETNIRRGNLNPEIKNTITRIINIDSSHRALLNNTTNSSDNFDFELNEPLLKVVSLSLYSVEIPQSWYTFSLDKGTVGFIVARTSDSCTRYSLRIADGNYTTFTFMEAFIKAIQNETALADLQASYTYDPHTGKITLLFKTVDIIQLIWVESTYSDPNMVNNRYNSNIGWLLGFRQPVTTCVPVPDTDNIVAAVAGSLVDACGTKYFNISLDDYKTCRLNRSIVSVNTTPKTPIALPKYYNENTPQYRDGINRIHAIQSYPRTLTTKQIYTINAISDQQFINQQILSQRSIQFDSSNLLAKIPVKRTEWGKADSLNQMEAIDNGPGRLFVESGGPLQQQMREYFGPVDILYFTVSLYDDKGYLLGLNGMDWSFTLLVKCLYQY